MSKTNDDNNFESFENNSNEEDIVVEESVEETGIDISEHDNFMENNIVVDIKDIKKNYGKKEVLRGINLQIKKGEKVTLFGPNGAGKSTLTEIISQIKEPSSGTINYSFGTTKKEIAKKIGIQFQETSYPYYFKVKHIIQFFADIYNVQLTGEKMAELMEQFQLKGLEKHRAASLSGGQKQRLNIMLAVMNQPELLLLDEVSTGLDIEARTNIKKFLKDYILEKNSTLILVSHNPDEIEYLTDRVVVIYDGLVFSDIKVKDMKAKYGKFDNYVDHLFLNEFVEYDKRKAEMGENYSNDHEEAGLDIYGETMEIQDITETLETREVRVSQRKEEPTKEIKLVTNENDDLIKTNTNKNQAKSEVNQNQNKDKTNELDYKNELDLEKYFQHQYKHLEELFSNKRKV